MERQCSNADFFHEGVHLVRLILHLRGLGAVRSVPGSGKRQGSRVELHGWVISFSCWRLTLVPKPTVTNIVTKFSIFMRNPVGGVAQIGAVVCKKSGALSWVSSPWVPYRAVFCRSILIRRVFTTIQWHFPLLLIYETKALHSTCNLPIVGKKTKTNSWTVLRLQPIIY